MIKSIQDSSRRKKVSPTFSDYSHSPEDKEPAQSISYNNQKFSSYIHEQLLKEKAKKFILRIRKEKSINDGMALVKKQAAEKKKEQLSVRQLKVQQEQRSLKSSQLKNLVLSKIKERRQEQTPKKQRKKVNTLAKIRAKTEADEVRTPKARQKIQVDLIPAAKKFRTIRCSQVAQSGQLPSIKPFKQRTMTSIHKGRESNLSQRQQKILFLPDQVRLKLTQINQKLSILNKMSTEPAHQ